ncbi:MAG: hypothetical protein AAFU67_08090, partial [Bacteroidota bacterium]
MKQTLLLLFLFLACQACDNDASDSPTQESAQSPGLDPAIERLSSAIQAQPDQPDLYASRAELWYNKSSYDNAIADLQAALAFD